MYNTRLNKFKVSWKFGLVDLANPSTIRQTRIGLGFLALGLVVCPSNTQSSLYLVVVSEKIDRISAILEVPKIEQESREEQILFTLLR